MRNLIAATSTEVTSTTDLEVRIGTLPLLATHHAILIANTSEGNVLAIQTEVSSTTDLEVHVGTLPLRATHHAILIAITSEGNVIAIHDDNFIAMIRSYAQSVMSSECSRG